MDVQAFLAGFFSALSLWVGVLLVAMAWSFAKRFMKS